ncbi:MAG: hypothetical protein EOP88_04360 [Verrucomicrobiaceae bacterium]|nr:MAG: hypothetical protein EOP88_04360 [Verrucomicrobiaceae bacterium]
MSINPYEAPQTFDAPPVQPDDPEFVRKQHINTETSIRSIGALYYLGGIILLITGIMGFNGLANITDQGVTVLSEAVAYGLFLGFAVFSFVVAAAVRKLKPWSRIGVGILSGIGLLAFPMGTLINAYILFLTFGKKGRMIFSDRYKEIIALTPHVKCRTSKSVWIILGIFVAIIVGGTIAIVFGSR